MLAIVMNRSLRLSANVGSPRSQHRRNITVNVTAGRRLSQKKSSTKRVIDPRQCPCGSGIQFRDCCGPIVGGAWARTAPELARARFTAVVLGDAKMLADTTHPEALDAIGTKQSLRKKVHKFMRFKRGAGEHPPALADSVHGQSRDNPDSWYVLLAVAVGPPGAEKNYGIAEHYRKDAGRWWFMGEARELPVLPQFEDFLQRYWNQDEDDMINPLQGRYDYSWLAVPPRELQASEAERRVQWLVDDWPEGVPGGWVYLDAAVDPETGLTAAQCAAQTQRVLNTMLQDPTMDIEDFYFRRGRFMQ